MRISTGCPEDILSGTGYAFDISSLGLHVANHVNEVEHERVVRRQARINHEYDHFVRTLGTSYGLVRYGMQTQFLLSFVHTYRGAGSLEATRQLWQTIQRSSTPQVTIQELGGNLSTNDLNASAFSGNCMLEALRSLDGQNLSEPSIVWMTGWAYYVSSLMGKRMNRLSDLNELLQRLWSKTEKAGHLIYIQGEPCKASTILEYLGIFIEVTYLTNYLANKDEVFPADLSAHEYLEALNAIKEFIPGGFDLDQDAMAREIEFALELALWVPLWPGITLDQLPLNATHFIPSYRLGLILDAWRELGLETTLNANDQAEDLAPFAIKWQSAICEYLGWPTPDFISKKWEEGLDFVKGAPELVDWYWHDQRSPRLDWSRTLVRELGERPVSGALLAGGTFYSTMSFPILFDHRQNPPILIPNANVPWPEEYENFKRMDYLLFSATRNALNASWWDSMDRSIQEEAQEIWLQLTD